MTTNQELILNRGGIDYTEAMCRFGDNETLFKRLAVKFLDDPHYEALKNALSESDADTALREAHTLKGVAGNLSFTDLYHAASRVNDALRENDAATANAHMSEVDVAYAATTEALRSAFV